MLPLSTLSTSTNRVYYLYFLNLQIYEILIQFPIPYFGIRNYLGLLWVLHWRICGAPCLIYWSYASMDRHHFGKVFKNHPTLFTFYLLTYESAFTLLENDLISEVIIYLCLLLKIKLIKWCLKILVCISDELELPYIIA